MESEKYGIEKRIHKLDVIEVAVNIIKENFKQKTEESPR